MTNIIEEDAGLMISHIDFPEMENKTVLITGASGLIGVYFIACLKLLSKKYKGMQVAAVFQTAPLPYLKNLLDFSGAKIYLGDITDVSFCRELPGADYIIHAAGYGQPLKFMEAPEKTLKLNTFSTFLLFDKLNKDGRFLFISSSEVYANLKPAKYTEEEIGISNTTHPRSCYIEGKRAGEAICNAYRTKGVHAYSARLAHTYGPGARKGDKRVLLSFIEKALAGKIDMLDHGEAIRTYCYVADAVEVMWKILLFGKEPVYNVAGQSKTTIAGLANIIGGVLNVPVIFPEAAAKGVAGAPHDLELNTDRATREFGKKTYTDLETGIKRTISWYQHEYIPQ